MATTGCLTGGRGPPSPKRMPLATVEKVLQLYQERYHDFNVRHFHEKLREEHGIQLSYTWVKLALQGAGLAKKARKRGVHRKQRPRRPLPGMMLHLDANPRQWFQDDRWYDLIEVLDDATNQTYYAQLVEEESTRTVMAALKEVIGRQAVGRKDYRNGFHFRDFVTRFGSLWLKIARTRERSFLPTRLEKFQRRADEIMLLIREAFLRGISTPQVRRLAAVLTGEAVKAEGQAIYRAHGEPQVWQSFETFRSHWQGIYPALVKKLGEDLPELLAFFRFPRHLWCQLRTTNIIERCFVEVRRRTRPMVCHVNAQSVDRIIFSIFNRFNEQWRNRTLRLFTQTA